MSDQLFIVLRVCLLALVYLVFLRVLRAVWVELRAEGAVGAPVPAPRAVSRGAAPAPTPAPVPRPNAPLPATELAPTAVTAARLVVVAPPGLAGKSFAVDGETTIGRGAGCAVAIDDAHVSKLHARISPSESGWILEDLGSTNGTLLDGDLVKVPAKLRAGGRIGLGEIVLEFG